MFTISESRISEIAKLANTSNHVAEEIITSDWTNAVDHQEWLDAAPAAEIASWVRSIAIDMGEASGWRSTVDAV